MGTLKLAAYAVAALVGMSNVCHALEDFTYVSTFGGDSGDCERGTPCKTLNYAYTQTNQNGTITMLDTGVYPIGAGLVPGSYLTFQGQGPDTVITNAGGSGILVGAGAVFRDLSIDPRGDTPGTFGIGYTNGPSLILENVVIRDQRSGDSAGIKLAGDFANLAVHLKNVSIEDSGQGSSVGAAFVIDAGPAGLTHRVTIENSAFSNNSRGIVVQGAGNVQLSLDHTTVSGSTGNAIEITKSAGTTKLTIKDSTIANNGGNGLMLYPTGSAKVNTIIAGSAFDANVIGIRSFPGGSAVSNVTISDTSASNNAGGIHASGKSVVSIIRGSIGGNSSYGLGAVSPAAVRIGSSVVSGNTLGLSGPISSYGNNQLLGNTTQGSSTPVAPGSSP